MHSTPTTSPVNPDPERTVLDVANSLATGRPVDPDDLRAARAFFGITPCCPPGEADPCRACAEPCEAGEPDAGPASAWPEWTDREGVAWAPEVTTLGPDDIDDAPPPARPDGLTLTLAEQVEQQVRGYRAWGNAAGDLIADHLAELAAEVAILGARTPDQLWDRRAAMAGHHD